jgi:hypothetical protein
MLRTKPDTGTSPAFRATRPDQTAQTSATFGYQAPVKRVIDEDTGERVGWMRPAYGEIEWSSFHMQGFAETEAEALKAIEAAVIEHRGLEAEDATYVAEIMALPEPARPAVSDDSLATFHCPEWTISMGTCCPEGAVRHECPALRRVLS